MSRYHGGAPLIALLLQPCVQSKACNISSKDVMQPKAAYMRDCSEVEQKTIRKLTIFDDDVTAPEVVIEFEDGTVFSASFTVRAAVDAKLTIDLGGEPQVIANYGSAL